MGKRITFTMFTIRTGIDVRRKKPILEGHAKAALYSYQGLEGIPLGSLELFVQLNVLQTDDAVIDLSEDMLLGIDQIIATLNAN